MATEDFGARA